MATFAKQLTTRSCRVGGLRRSPFRLFESFCFCYNEPLFKSIYFGRGGDGHFTRWASGRKANRWMNSERPFQYRLSSLFLAITVVAQVCAVIRWFGFNGFALIYMIGVPVLIPLLLRSRPINWIKQWWKWSVYVSLFTLTISLLLSSEGQPGIAAGGFFISIWSTFVIWIYWTYREVLGMCSTRYHELNMKGR